MEIKVMHQIMEWNEDVSDQVKETLSDHKICMINVMGSPGAGKTSMIVALIAALRETYRIGVIEGDIAGQIDAETIDKLGIPVVQLDTDGACHIEAESVRHMLPLFPLEDLDVLLVEPVNLLQVAMVIGKYQNGLYADYPHLIRHLRTREITIRCFEDSVVNLDGECLRTSDITFRVSDNKVRFFYPAGLTYHAKSRKLEESAAN